MADEVQTEATPVETVDYSAMTQEEYQASRGQGPLAPPAEQADTAETPTETPVESAPTDDDDARGVPPGVQKRINTVVRQREEWKSLAESEQNARRALEARMQALEQQQAPRNDQQEPAQGYGPPDPDNYETHDEYVADAARYHARAEINAERQNAAQMQELARLQALTDGHRAVFQASMTAAREAHPDFDEVISNAEVAPEPLLVKAVAYNEQAGELGFYLCSNPDEMTRLNAITDGTRLLVEVARLEARILPTEQPIEQPVQPRRTAVPPPVSAPTGDLGGGNVAKDPTSSQEAWQEWRRKGGGRPTG